MSRNWPGNIRELENSIQRSVAFSQETTIVVADLDARPVTSAAEDAAAPTGGDASLLRVEISADGVNLDEKLTGLEERYILRALEVTGGSVTRAAGLLGTSFRSLRYRISKLGIDRHNV